MFITLHKRFSECSYFLLLQKLHEEVHTIQQAGSRDHTSPSISPRIEAIIMSQLDKALVKHQQQHMALLEELLLQREDKERKRQEALMCAISQAIGNLVTAKLQDVVTAEIKNSIMPGKQLLQCHIESYIIYWFPVLSDSWTTKVNSSVGFEDWHQI